jgi:hypothetical protein
VSRCTWLTIARSRQLQCLSPYYITAHPAKRHAGWSKNELLAVHASTGRRWRANGGLHSLVAAASLFARSLAAVSNKPVHVPLWDAACSCLATRRIILTLYLGVMGQPGSIRGVCGPPSLLPVHSVCKLFSTVAAVLSASPAALPIRGSRSVALLLLSITCAFSESPYSRLAKTCRFLQASMD